MYYTHGSNDQLSKEYAVDDENSANESSGSKTSVTHQRAGRSATNCAARYCASAGEAP
jgi:hypothetical protein